MKDEVLKRGMFSKPMSKSARNSGIMEGFEDEMEDEGTPPLVRSPQNPEILMNNLRGDMRSVDARYLELAQMVGEQAAMETPPEVLAMLQPQLAAQAAPAMPQGGIGALPQGAEMAPPPMMGQAMPPGMEGMPPFPQGGAEQAPPTPDGMPPLRAADGVFVTQDARQARAGDAYDPLYIPPRFQDLTSGKIPEDQMTEQEKRFLKTYKFGMGFTGGSIRDVASQGFGRISSALSPYVQRGINYLDELVTPLTRPTMRVEPMVEAGRRAVIQGRENIVQGTRGAEMGTGTKLQGANTLGFGQIPFSQAVRENPLLGRMVDVGKRYPASTVTGTAGVAGTLAALSGDRNPPPRSAEDLKKVNALIDQIPGQGPPLRDAKGNRIIPPGRENEPFEVNFRDDRIVPPVPERPEDATINRLNTAEQPPVDFTPFTSMGDRTTRGDLTRGLPPKVDISNKTFIDDNLLKGDVKDQVFKTRGERIKAEFESLAPTFKELLGDTKADARTNALLLLADAGFKFASTYKPTMAMALGESLSGVPRGFAALVAQAKDRDIRVKTAVLQQATENVNLQDKVARDFQLENLRINGRLANSVFQAKTRKELEEIKQRNALQLKTMERDFNLMLEEVKQGGTLEEDGGMGLTIVKKKNGSYLGNYIKPDANGQLPPVVKGAIDSRWTLRQTDNPFVDNLGAAPTTVETDKGERVKLGNTLRSLENSLKTFDNLRGQYAELYSPGTWFTDKINNVIVPISGGLVRPDVNQAAAAQQLRSGLNQVQKSIASANDQGRVAVQEQEWAREILDGLNNPTGFFQNKELAAKSFASMEAQLRNARQNVLTQLGYVSEDFTMKTPQTGTQVDPFIIPADQEGQTRMLRYLGSTIGTLQDPKAIVYLRMPNGRVDAFTPIQLRGLVQK
jgi:hypothetical protein